LSPALALEVIAQVARALVAAEAQGLVHRDLKPANLMLVEGPELTVKVIDFGLAKAVTTAGSEADLTHGGFVGTPAFASPERFTGASVDVRSDLYSLVITLWDMLTGQTPFRGSPTEMMYQHQHAPLRRPPKLGEQEYGQSQSSALSCTNPSHHESNRCDSQVYDAPVLESGRMGSA